MLVKHIFIQRAPPFSLAIAYRLLAKSVNHLAGLPSRDNWEEVTSLQSMVVGTMAVVSLHRQNLRRGRICVSWKIFVCKSGCLAVCLSVYTVLDSYACDMRSPRKSSFSVCMCNRRFMYGSACTDLLPLDFVNMVCVMCGTASRLHHCYIARLTKQYCFMPDCGLSLYMLLNVFQ